MKFEKSVVIGESNNLGEPATYTTEDGVTVDWHRSVPLPADL